MIDSAPILLVLAIIAYAWWETVGAKRRARHVARRACRRAGVTFLDELGLASIGVRRDAGGHRRLWRHYRFEFCIDNDLRFPGRVEMLGRQVSVVDIDAIHPSVDDSSYSD